MMLSHAKACSTVTAISKKATVCNSESGSCHQGMLPSTNSLQLRIWELPPRNATEQPTVSVSESGSRHQEVLRKQPTVSHSESVSGMLRKQPTVFDSESLSWHQGTSTHEPSAFLFFCATIFLGSFLLPFFGASPTGALAERSGGGRLKVCVDGASTQLGTAVFS